SPLHSPERPNGPGSAPRQTGNHCQMNGSPATRGKDSLPSAERKVKKKEPAHGRLLNSTTAEQTELDQVALKAASGHPEINLILCFSRN
ncbi:MAG: hypothetical protein RR326_15400, partial [Stenotrophomonas sp.]